MSALRVGFIGVCGVVFRAEHKGFGGFAHGKIALCDFEGVDERGAGGGYADAFGIFDVVAALYHVCGCCHRVVGGVGGNDDEVYLFYGIGQVFDGDVYGFDGHGVGVFIFACFAPGFDAGAGVYPFVVQAVYFFEIGVRKG